MQPVLSVACVNETCSYPKLQLIPHSNYRLVNIVHTYVKNLSWPVQANINYWFFLGKLTWLCGIHIQPFLARQLDGSFFPSLVYTNSFKQCQSPLCKVYISTRLHSVDLTWYTFHLTPFPKTHVYQPYNTEYFQLTITIKLSHVYSIPQTCLLAPVCITSMDQSAVMRLHTSK